MGIHGDPGGLIMGWIPLDLSHITGTGDAVCTEQISQCCDPAVATTPPAELISHSAHQRDLEWGTAFYTAVLHAPFIS